MAASLRFRKKILPENVANAISIQIGLNFDFLEFFKVQNSILNSTTILKKKHQLFIYFLLKIHEIKSTLGERDDISSLSIHPSLFFYLLLASHKHFVIFEVHINTRTKS
jgi:hypothetical protein